ncbi:MAG: hypothetical protein LBU64_14800 [Planctomycetota bacterium]|jgi:hypothetical protein|nr:hypothetical protein [Planctomycetota bacterium]
MNEPKDKSLSGLIAFAAERGIEIPPDTMNNLLSAWSYPLDRTGTEFDGLVKEVAAQAPDVADVCGRFGIDPAQVADRANALATAGAEPGAAIRAALVREITEWLLPRIGEEGIDSAPDAAWEALGRLLDKWNKGSLSRQPKTAMAAP